MRYQAIFFDLDGTLRESEPRFMDALHACLGEQGIHVSGFRWRLTERWVHHYWAQSLELLEDVAEAGSVWSRFLARLMAHAGHEPGSEAEVQAFVEHLRQCYQPSSHLMPGVNETLAGLRDSGMTLGVVSNRQDPFTEELEELGIAESFHFTLAAGEIGYWKPRPEIFTEALNRAGGIQPAAALYIGDNYYADIVGATQAGLDAILLDDRHIFTDILAPRIERLDKILDFLTL